MNMIYAIRTTAAFAISLADLLLDLLPDLDCLGRGFPHLEIP